MPASSSPLRIAVVGAGRIGSTFAARLARTGGHDVTVVARPGSLRWRQLAHDGAIVEVGGARTEMRVRDRLDEETPYDLVIVTVLAHQVEPLLPALQRSAAACVQFMFNTFDPERLAAAVGAERCAFGMPFVQATLDADGRLKASVGAGGQKSLMSRARAVELFAAAGLPAAIEPDMPLWLRCHAPLCVAFESVSVLAERRGGGASWAQAHRLACGVHAGFALIRALGRPIYPRAKRALAAAPVGVLAAMLWSVSRVRPFRELLATGGAECDALVDAMLAAAPPGTPLETVADIAAMRP